MLTLLYGLIALQALILLLQVMNTLLQVLAVLRHLLQRRSAA